MGKRDKVEEDSEGVGSEGDNSEGGGGGREQGRRWRRLGCKEGGHVFSTCPKVIFRIGNFPSFVP